MSSPSCTCPSSPTEGLYGLLISVLLAVVAHIAASARRAGGQSRVLSALHGQLSELSQSTSELSSQLSNSQLSSVFSSPNTDSPL